MRFMGYYNSPVEFVNLDTEAAAQIIGNHDIIPAEVAAKAIPECSIVFYGGRRNADHSFRLSEHTK